jgi:thymidylate kinase
MTDATSGHAAFARVDAVAGERVLLFGSPPPHGRDIDLLVRPAAYRTISAALASDGYASSGRCSNGTTFVLFANCSAIAVELVGAAAWRLPQQEVTDLFSAATPVDAYAAIVAPAPEHLLLIAARRLVHGRPLRPRDRARVADAIRADPEAWARAERRAPAWHVQAMLELLRVSVDRATSPRRNARIRAIATDRGGTLPALRALAPRPRRSTVVVFSGLDGAGKSFQSARLRDALERLGHEAVVVWRPFGTARATGVLAQPVRRLLRVGGRGGGSQRLMSAQGAPRTGVVGRLRGPWIGLVAALDVLGQRRATAAHAWRGRVVIFDRGPLDSIVRMRAIYGDDDALAIQQRLIALLAPRAHFAYLLDIRPETSLARKDDVWSLDDLRHHAQLYRRELSGFPRVRRVDGEQPSEQVCAEVGLEVWRGLR